ncbi:MAG: thiol-disulfide oxidoreductase DCC family protein [Rariglobus sp.]|nr:DCC1-like thiol-disulfide oxidoreductase family protein [Rariglobus sp.]
MSPSPQPVLLYDGECGLCNALMRFMLRRDRRGVLRFAPLQGTTGQAFLKSHGLNTEDFDSLVFIQDLTREGTPFFLRTAGALRAMSEMGGGWRRLARMLAIMPSCCSDLLYQCIARLRYRLFGRYRPTPLPNPEWVKRILD